jgi:hypothetical protein
VYVYIHITFQPVLKKPLYQAFSGELVKIKLVEINNKVVQRIYCSKISISHYSVFILFLILAYHRKWDFSVALKKSEDLTH